jgi:hypothetical protein
MGKEYGKKTWFIPDCFWPTRSNGYFPSHEAICVLNTGKKDAHIEITLYFEDKEKMDGFKVVCPSERTMHFRMDGIKDVKGNPVPQGVSYAALVESNEDIVVQYSRMDTTQSEMALMTTIAY